MGAETYEVVFEAVDRSQQLRSFDQRVEESAAKSAAATDKIKSGWASVGGIIAGAAAAAGAALMALGAIGIKTAMEQEEAVNRLNAALRAQGRYSAIASKDLQKAAEDFAAVSRYSGQAILDVMAQLQFVGAGAPEQIKKATKAVLDFSAATGMDLQSAAMAVGKAMAGQTMALSRFGLVIDETEVKARGFDVVLDAIAKHMGGAAQAATQTFAGRFRQVTNSIVDMLGRGMSPLLEKIVEWLNTGDNQKLMLDTIRDAVKLLGGAISDVVKILTDLAPAINAIVTGVAGAVKAAADVFDAIKDAYDKLPQEVKDWIRRGLENVAAFPQMALGILAPVKSPGKKLEKVSSQYTQLSLEQIFAFANAAEKGRLETEKMRKETEGISDAARDAFEHWYMLYQQQKKSSEEAAKEHARIRQIVASIVEQARLHATIIDMEKLRNDLLISAIQYDTERARSLAEQAGFAQEIADAYSKMKVGAAGQEGPLLDTDDIELALGLLETPPGGFHKNWSKAIGDAFAEGFANALDNLGSFLQALQRAINAAATKGLELAFGDSFWGKIGSALGGSLIGSLFGWMFGGGGTKIDPAALAKPWEEVFKGYTDAIKKWLDDGVAITDSMMRAIEGSLKYNGDKWVDYIDDMSDAYDRQVEAIAAAREQLYQYHQQLAQGRMALFSYHEALFDARRAIVDLRKSLLELARSENIEEILRYTRPAATQYGVGAAGEQIAYHTAEQEFTGTAAYEKLMEDIKNLPTNKYGQIRWKDAQEMISRVNDEAKDLVLNLIKEMNQVGMLQMQIDNQKHQINLLRDARAALHNNLPEMKTTLGRIRDFLSWMKEHWRETSPEGGGGGGDKPGRGWEPGGGRKVTSTTYSQTNVSNVQAPSYTIPVILDGKEIKRIVLTPAFLKDLEIARRRQAGATDATMRG